MIRNTLMLFAVAGFAALVACSSDDAGERYPSPDSFCSAKAEAECEGVAAQCGASLDACKDRRVVVCTDAANAAIGSGRQYKAPLAEGCIEKTRALFDLKTLPPDKEDEQSEACERVFEGQTAKNASCGGDYECSADLVCDKGVCATEVVKSIDEGCANPGEVCDKGSYCGQVESLTRCLAKKSEGDLCTADVPCKEELRCAGTCRAKYAPGEVCATSAECSDAAPYCEPTQKKCIAKSFAAGTAACKEFGGF
jgi:hypothetical protein